jgi:hypothetical protein
MRGKKIEISNPNLAFGDELLVSSFVRSSEVLQGG